MREDVEGEEGAQGTSTSTSAERSNGIRGERHEEAEENILSRSGSGSDKKIGRPRRAMPIEEGASYVPAETIDGLEWLGSPVWKVRRKKMREEKMKDKPKWGV